MQRYSTNRPLLRAKGTLLKNIALVGIALALLGALILFVGYIWISSTLPSTQDITNRDVAQSTKIFDRTGEHLLYEIAADEKRTIVPYENIPQNLINATLTAEDRQFFHHHGISYLGIARSIYEDIKCGCKAQGASTLTQQMVRNVILTLDKTFTRKIKEILLSYAVEDQFTKEEILGLYLNQIGYGSTNYGVEAASQAYFNKNVQEITLAEAAVLAALPKQPSRYLNDPELLKARRDWILTSMEELGYASHDDVVAALATETPITAKLHNITAPHFVLWVKEQLEQTYTEREIETGGLRVITTLDYDKQMAAESAIKTGVESKGEAFGFNNAALMAQDPKTGQILAMVGSADYFNDDIQGQVNVTQQALQPGSSMKPIIYAAAFEKGYTPDTILWDVDTLFTTDTGPYQPHNYDGKEHGHVTMRTALQGSLNIPAVKTMYLVGVENALNFTDRLGYSTLNDRSRYGLSLALGGGEVTMNDHLRAYSTFANNGLQHETIGILKIEDATGKTLAEWRAEDYAGKQVIEPNIAAILSNVLSDNNARSYVFGTNSALQLGARPVAAKTGTTNDFNDAWTMGYTPSLATGVWVGNTDGTKMFKNAEAIFVAAPIWKAFMQEALNDSPIETFPAPTLEKTGKDMLDGIIPTQQYTLDTSSGKLASDLTPTRFRQEISCGDYHTILTYINKDDPRGPIPEDPTKDPYFQSWEDAVQQWIVRHNAALKEGEEVITTCQDIPTEYDTTHTEENIPTIHITAPHNGEQVERTLSVSLNASIHRTLSRLTYAIDGIIVETSSNMDGETLTLPTWVNAGEHTLHVTIYDDVDNHATDSIVITVNQSSSEQTRFHITNPFAHQTIENTGNPYNVVIEIPETDTLTYLEVTAENLWTGQTRVIGSTMHPSPITSIPWSLGENGEYQLTARAATTTGKTLEAMPIAVTVIAPTTTLPLLSTP